MSILLFALFLACLAQAEPSPAKRKVVLVVWDGMRPDFVTSQYAPTLAMLADSGVFFSKHHSTYPTATQVNGTVLATGVHPARSGLLANREYRPAIRLEAPVDTAVDEILRKGEELAAGKYLAVPTIAETIRAAGRTVVVAGSKSVARLIDRHAPAITARRSELATVFVGSPLLEERRAELNRLLGPFLIQGDDTHAQRNTFTTRALTEILWRDDVPDFSTLWLSDPDLTQHEHAPGSPEALAAIQSSDRNLAAILRALEEKGARQNTNVLVVSDHGFSTITRAIDLPAFLRAAGFDAPDRLPAKPKAGQVMIVANGGSTLFYVVEHEPDTVGRLVETLQRSDFAGVIFTREKMEGAFPLATAHLDTAAPPDVVLAMRWAPGENCFGVPGELFADAKRAVGKGTHASLSRFDVHNILIAAGPDFRAGLRSETPSGNIDLAPTILHLLGVKPAVKMDGRILREALAGVETPPPKMRTDKIEATRDFGARLWRQYLERSHVGDHIYIDEGNGAPVSKVSD